MNNHLAIKITPLSIFEIARHLTQRYNCI